MYRSGTDAACATRAGAPATKLLPGWAEAVLCRPNSMSVAAEMPQVNEMNELAMERCLPWENEMTLHTIPHL